MMNRRMSRLLTLALCLVLCACAWPSAANAFEPVDLSLPGVTFTLHQVAGMTEEAQFELLSGYSAFTGDINKLQTAADWAAAAAAMQSLAAGVAADASCVTDANGLAAFSGLKPGLYLVSGAPLEIAPWAYSFSPFIVSLPTRDQNDNWIYDVISDIKLERTPAVTSIEVVKLWSDEGYEKNRPNEIYVDLYQDGEQLMAAQLHAGNSWSYTFTNLPAAHTYTIQERKVPNGYEASYETVNGVLVVRNTYKVEATPVPEIPQTGQLWWPVPLLAGLGTILFVMGFIVHRKWSQEHEES